jgi:Zn-dependent peptidase ImmA (M78 family)/transcriptional regulator with XRE-family HTH domain
MKGTEVPVTPSVLEWAIQESGYSVPEVAKQVGVEEAELGGWIHGRSRPKLTAFRKLAAVLHRPAATFLLSEPPARDLIAIKFRRPPNVGRVHLNPDERRYIREGARVQETLSWLLQQMGELPVTLPQIELSASTASVAADARQRLGVSLNNQLEKWKNEYQAQAGWRDALEASGVSVLMLRLGEGSCRGFSIWDDFAPLAAVNTYFRGTARIFSMLHEFGHLLTRSSSACLEHARGHRLAKAADPTERWCEQFAAAVLLPEGAVRRLLRAELGWDGRKVTDLGDASSAANRFKVSLRAMVIRLIEMGAAEWDLYRKIPAHSDDKPTGGGGKGLSRAELREKEFGRRLEALFVKGMRDDLISRGDVINHLRLSEDDLESLEKMLRA